MKKEFMDVVKRARERYRFAMEWESDFRQRYLEDVKFANADPDNGWQWPTNYLNTRGERPTLTINKVRQHNLNIINDAKQNKPAIKFRAMGSGATSDAAQVWDAIARHIEYQSNAQAHYDRASTFQVQGGIGYLRVLTDYESDMSFNQEIYVTSIPDPLTVLLDPDAKAPSKCDARYGFIAEDVAREVFELRYPKYVKYAGQGVFNDSNWLDDKHVRVAEYYEAVDIEDELILVEELGEPMFVSHLKKLGDAGKKLLESKNARRRDVFRREIRYHFIVGDQIVEEEEALWPGKYIPLIPVIGEETIIENKMDRKGHTRAMKDPQRMYNYWSSAAVEYGALQSKTPWIVALESVEGYQNLWETANKQNHAYLPYRAIGENGVQLPPPQRVEPPVPSPVALKGMEMANLEMQMVSGQYENQLGQQGNERTGKAIMERQRQGDKATYHFIDNLAIAIQHVGEIIFDLVPKIYDTERVINVLAENGESYEVMLDPQMEQAHQAKVNAQGEVVLRVLNPNVGKYEVMADVGPAYATKKEEAFNALTLILTQAPQLTSLIGDILLRAGDFPMADEAAERLRRMVPPQALGKGPTPNEQAMQQEIELLKKALVAAMEKLSQEMTKAKARFEKRDIEIYNAITNRIKALGPEALDIQSLENLVEEVLVESSEVPISDVFEHNAENREQGDLANTGLDLGQQMFTGGLPQQQQPQPQIPAAPAPHPLAHLMGGPNGRQA